MKSLRATFLKVYIIETQYKIYIFKVKNYCFFTFTSVINIIYSNKSVIFVLKCLLLCETPTGQPAYLLKVTLLHECFSRFLNCTNGATQNICDLEIMVGVYESNMTLMPFQRKRNVHV